jgi:hypothetical protein
MAKAQGKKTAVAKRGTTKPAARRAAVATAKKPAKKPEAPKARAAKAAAKPAPKPAPKAKAATPAPAPKPVAKAPAPKAKAAPEKPVAAPKAAPAPAPGPKAAPKPAPAPAVEKRARRPRPRITSSGGPAANWLKSGEKPRPSSFMPAPARAEAPSLVAAPPASSDRLIRHEDLAAPATRTVPVRIDIEYSAGRVYVLVSPMEVSLRANEGIEWDIRYLGGADVMVDEVVIELEKPSPFGQTVFRCKKPGIGRPQRQLSGGASAGTRRIQYTIRAINQFKTELGAAKPYVTIS